MRAEDCKWDAANIATDKATTTFSVRVAKRMSWTRESFLGFASPDKMPMLKMPMKCAGDRFDRDAGVKKRSDNAAFPIRKYVGRYANPNENF